MKNDKKLRIAFFVNYFPKISETFILDQVASMINHGHEVDIFPREFTKEKEIHQSVIDYDLLSITYYPVKLPKNVFLRTFRIIWFLFYNRHIEIIDKLVKNPDFLKSDIRNKCKLFSYLMPFREKKKYDIIHCHFGPSAFRALFIKSLGLLEGKLITTFYGYDVNIHSIGKDYYSRLFQECKRFIAISKYIEQRAISLGCQQSNIRILPIGIDLTFFKPNPGRKINRTIRLLSVGRLVEKKGIEYAIRAFKKIETKYPDLVYDIVGDGVLFDFLNQIVSDLQLNGKVFFHGAKDQASILNFYHESDIFILPCVTARDGDAEGQGLVFQEAQATELPVIATFHNGISEGVLINKTGFLVPERDVDTLADKIELLVTDNNLRLKMGKLGREFVSGRYDNTMLHNELINIYMSLV